MANGKREMLITLRGCSLRDLVAVVTSVLLATSQAAAAGVNKPPAAEEVAVDKAFMAYFAHQAPYAQVADVRYPIPIDNADQCLHGIKLDKNDAALTDVRTLPQEIISDTDKFRLVTIRSESEHHERLLRLSDVAFDARHQYAVLNYNYHCGILCGQSGTAVFKKLGQTWKHIRSCTEWIS